MALVLPIDKGSNNTWDSILDTVFGLIDAHDHTAGKGVLVPSAALNINANIQLASGGNHYALYDALGFDFFPSAAATLASFAGCLFMNSADNELYWRTAGGVNVKLTAGAALNVAAFVGGIGGDYSAVSALLSYDDATRRYLLQQEVSGAVRPWAGHASADVDLYEKALLAGIPAVNKVSLQSPHALAASYAVQWPPALPAQTSGVYVTSAGAMAFIPPDQTLLVPASMADLFNNTRQQITSFLGENGIGLAGGVGNYSAFPIPLKVGDTIKSIIVYVNKVTSNTTTLGASWVQTNGGSGATTIVSNTLATNAPGYTTIAINAINTVVAAGMFMHCGVAVTVGAGVTDQVLGIAILYTPAV